MEAKGNSKITIIQGDSYTKYVYFENIPAEAIGEVWFSSLELGVKKRLQYDEISNRYVLTLSSTETAGLSPTRSTYDLTIFFVDATNEDNHRTAIYNAGIEILPKLNFVKQKDGD